ncbi:MAG: long-chain fatty acid--CoA ligase [Ornithinimicrobium sp.]|uniref:AMP-dependent synthetase/ligase n=1 Tax=Ornithinimicrobium sp. TaxID=1977084 RepID=UPI0026E045C2|nr:long-chain fatty acid--CoA ligase [Ornithinimicrobium sp.]MDO5739354.1 long-chain fatty acid--CoA ligase [Ornithinimicrobium sp.]
MALSVTDEVIDLSLIEDREPTVGHMFRSRVAALPSTEAFRYPVGGDWESLTWTQTRDRAYALAAGLIELGVAAEERVALAASTRIEWVLADLAVMCAGAATTTIYPTTLAEGVSYIVADSGSRVIIAEDTDQLAKLLDHRESLGDVVKVILIDGTYEDEWVMTFAELEESGRARLEAEPGLVDSRIDATRAEHLATIIYTSGTTGLPKGVRLPHSAWTYEAASVAATGILSQSDLQFLWLPLAHVFGKVLLTLPLQMGFPTAVDGRVELIVENVGIIKPTFMGAAPRIFEKAYGKITTMMADEGGVKAKLFDWASTVGKEVSLIRGAGGEPGGLLAWKFKLADKLVLSKIRDRFGGRVRFFISGSAALNQDVAQWFDAMGLLIIEGYGLTETSAASVVNRPYPGQYKFGSVGWPLPGTEVKIAEDGEILLRGPGVTTGYHKLPDATAEALSPDGWLATGDIGQVDAQGFLTITDRKKDLFKTSGGKYVAPSRIESVFKGICPYASQLVIEGSGRKFVSALITLDPDAIIAWGAKNGMAGDSYSTIVTSQACRDMVQGYVDELNGQLDRWEQVKKFHILDHDLTVEEGDLTPSMKLKRKQVVTKYKDELDKFYVD